jgi:hypothetical protein
VEDRPTPIVQAEADDPEAQLQLDPNAWQHKWDNTQAGGDVCLYKMWLAGPPGPVKLIVRCAVCSYLYFHVQLACLSRICAVEHYRQLPGAKQATSV